MEPRGRLELTWANKHLGLISGPEDGDERVNPADPRVSDVRLLHDDTESGLNGSAARE